LSIIKIIIKINGNKGFGIKDDAVDGLGL